MSDWVVPNFHKVPKNSIFDKEYDYLVSLGHRCCVGQALNYMRKSSFIFDWQITPIDVLPKVFKNKFKDVYPDSGVEFAHVIYHTDDEGNDTDQINHEATNEIYVRRSQRLVKLLEENERRLLLVRHKYVWYWSEFDEDNPRQSDGKPIKYDLEQLCQISDTIKNDYGNDKFDIMYIYQDLSCLEEFKWDSKGDIPPEEFILDDGQTMIEKAKKFTYIEQYGYKDKNITPIIIKPNERVEGNAMISAINSFVKLTDVHDFPLPYGYEKIKLSRNIDVE